MTSHDIDAHASHQLSSDAIADAFGPVTLAQAATAPNGAHLFRVQHERLISLMKMILASTEKAVDGENAVLARSALTQLSTLLPLHQSLEESFMNRALSSETRTRILAEQFEREMAPMLADLASLARIYPSASSILRSPAGEFAHTCSALFVRLQERFRREERELFASYDRSTAGTAASSLVA